MEFIRLSYSQKHERERKKRLRRVGFNEILSKPDPVASKVDM